MGILCCRIGLLEAIVHGGAMAQETYDLDAPDYDPNASKCKHLKMNVFIAVKVGVPE